MSANEIKQDEIIRMALEAGLSMVLDDEGEKVVERFAALVAAHEAEKWKAENKRDYENWKMAAEKAAECEREACAKVCKDIANSQFESGESETAGVLDHCAAAIQARG